MGLNLYMYCYNNPINYIDPSGRDAIYVLNFGIDYDLPIVGHAQLYIQDANGNWYLTQYFNIEDPTVYCRSIDQSEIDKLYSQSIVDKSVIFGWRICGIVPIRIYGDFSASVTLAQQLTGSHQAFKVDLFEENTYD